jgi:hypothetical protein
MDLMSASMFLVQTPDGGWTPGIGDPTFTGWLTVVCYFAAAYQCYRAYQKARSLGPNAYRLSQAWLVLLAGMCLLGINKQLDLQSLLTVIARQNARDYGWYDDRRTFQVALIGVLGLSGLAGGAWVAWYMRKHLKHFGIAAAGAVFLAVFIMVRASTFHHVDLLLHAEAMGVSFNALLELSGIACIALNARKFARKRLRQKSPD